MDTNNMKNIVVLKDLQSNMVDEAFIILKSNVKIHKVQLVDKEKRQQMKKEKMGQDDYIIKEAEMIISDYISKIEKKDKIDEQKLAKKYKKLKIFAIWMTAFSLILTIISLIK